MLSRSINSQYTISMFRTIDFSFFLFLRERGKTKDMHLENDRFD